MKEQASQEYILKARNLYPSWLPDFSTAIDHTGHVGGVTSTHKLIESCNISEGKYVLDVGCGVGRTPCYIAKHYGCKVVGVDISDKLIERSTTRAKRQGIEASVEFRVANAQNLPFENDLFDAVICESVLAYIDDKQRAVNEFARVTKQGGYIGLNEATWVANTMPPQKVVSFIERAMPGATFLTSDGWKELLAKASMRDVVERHGQGNFLVQMVSMFKFMGLVDFFGVKYRMLHAYITNPGHRNYIRKSFVKPASILDYRQYRVYTGMK